MSRAPKPHPDVETVVTPVSGCVELRPPRRADSRGVFVKPFSREAFAQLGLSVDWHELFWTCSRRGVVRGFHIQLPPHDHAKFVFCVAGTTHNVALDLRRDSPAYGKSAVVALSAKEGNALYMPSGVAHAFQALTDDATLVYLAGSAHAPSHDHGGRWDSAGFEWPLPLTEVSERDAALPLLGEFDSPFRFTG